MSCVLVMPVSPGGLEASIETMPGIRLPNRTRRGAGRYGELDPLRPYVSTGSAGHRCRRASAANFGPAPIGCALQPRTSQPSTRKPQLKATKKRFTP
jgi:hypothetical protein